MPPRPTSRSTSFVVLVLAGSLACGSESPPSQPTPHSLVPAPRSPPATTLIPVSPTAATATTAAVGQTPDADALRGLLTAVRGRLLATGARDGTATATAPTAGDAPTATQPAPDRWLVVASVGRPDSSAWVAAGRGPTLEAAGLAAADHLANRLADADRSGLASGALPLKLDVALHAGPALTLDAELSLPRDFTPSLDGLLLADTDVVLLPEELASRSLVRSDRIQADGVAAYLAGGSRPDGDHASRTHTSATSPDAAAATLDRVRRALTPGATVHRLRFVSLLDDGGEPIPLYRGSPEVPTVSIASLRGAARAGGDYLLAHQLPSGLLAYQYDPRADAYDDGDNQLRQGGTAYALAELAAATGDRRYLAAAERVLAALQRSTRAVSDAPDAPLALVDDAGIAKLGGAALFVLASARCQTAGGCADLAAPTRRMAAYLLAQQREDGSFVSKVDLDTGDAEDFDSIYYPGEAILALQRLDRLTPNPTWVDAAARGARWLITVRDAGKRDIDLPHDHWLLMGLDELAQRQPDEPLWRDHARRIADAIVAAQHRAATAPDWIGGFYDPPRSTPTATRAEGLVAWVRMARRAGTDDRRYVETLRLASEFQLRCHLAPVTAMYLPRPDRALGGMRKSLTAWPVRIDYVQHSSSAFLGLADLLAEEEAALANP